MYQTKGYANLKAFCRAINSGFESFDHVIQSINGSIASISFCLICIDWLISEWLIVWCGMNQNKVYANL